MNGECITWQELDAYITRSFAIITPGGCEALIEASRAYRAGVTTYYEKGVPPPFGELAKQSHAERVARAIAEGFRQFTKKE